MGSLTSIVPSIIQLGSTLGKVSNVATNVYQDKVALDQLQQRQNLDYAQAQQNIALEQEQNRLDAQHTEQQRRVALRRAVARQRASFGGQGISQDSGSAEAVLLGLFSESEEERQAREKSDSLREQALQQDLSHSRQLNLLQQTQLKERQRINRITDFF